MKIETVSGYHILIDTKSWCKRGGFKAWNSQVLGDFLDEFFDVFIATKVSLVKLKLRPFFLMAVT